MVYSNLTAIYNDINTKDNIMITNTSDHTTNHWISFGYYPMAENQIHINLYIDGLPFGYIVPIYS